MTLRADDSEATLYFLTHVYPLGFVWARLCS